MKDARKENGQANDVDYDGYLYGHPSYWSCITDVSLRSDPRYDKHGREIPGFGSCYNLEPGSLTPHIEEEDDIDARLAALYQKIMVQILKILTLENTGDNNERMEGGESEYLPQHTHFSNKGKHNLFDEWMDSIERLYTFVTNEPTDMEVDEEAMNYMEGDPAVLMLREEGTY